jgi:hypothetical protein
MALHHDWLTQIPMTKHHGLSEVSSAPLPLLQGEVTKVPLYSPILYMSAPFYILKGILGLGQWTSRLGDGSNEKMTHRLDGQLPLDNGGVARDR